MNNNVLRFFYISAIILFVLYACQRKKSVLVQKIEPKKRMKIKIQTQHADFQYLSTKSKIEFTDGVDQFQSQATFRFRKDSVIWISVNPALGIEAIRCLITRDSVFIINRLQKEYYLYSYKSLSEYLNYELNYDLIQNILFGNIPFTQSPEDSTEVDSTFSILHQSRKNFAIDNYIRNNNMKLERFAARDVTNDNILEINYDNFKKINEILFAFTNKISLSFRSRVGYRSMYVGIEHHKVEIADKELKFPFNIKQKWERRE
ncbi:MAG: DUF4292 domain-containing protein [Cytophagales bacterium]|nr:DUF4292 domain-containing protein [Cytophagales bacterium]